ncbi:hypothetical protein EDB85DRAFT_1873035, partial [Lactarius pseudohatsudake]
ASALFLRRLKGLGDNYKAMADAGAVLGEVLAQWPQMFRILNLFRMFFFHSSVVSS